MKDYQGSLALSIVGNGYGSSFVYHPYGAQNLVRTDGQPPSEQYTGKEWSGTYEFYYYGARFLDPVLGMWSVPDPAGQFANPYSFGGDPVNGVDRDGRFFKELGAALLGPVSAAYVGGMNANGGEWKPTKWDWNNGDTYMGMGSGAAVSGGVGGIVTYGVGVTTISTAARIGYNIKDGNYDKAFGSAWDCATGGCVQKTAGNSLGVVNTYGGGKVNWYNGYMVYSGGFVGDMMEGRNQSGMAHLGVVFVVDRRDKTKIAHELDHLQQQEYTGFFPAYGATYMWEGNGDLDGSDPGEVQSDYYGNVMEQEAYFTEWCYKNKIVDVYGNKKRSITQDDLDRFQKWYFDEKNYEMSDTELTRMYLRWEKQHD